MPQAQGSEPFDPLAVENVGVTLAVELLEQPLQNFPPDNKFAGAGVYALYYRGAHSAYKSLVDFDAGKMKLPVYIGKAARENTRQGFNPRPETASPLFNRLRKHAQSVGEVENLNTADFFCRYLVLNDAYIALAESVMIAVFRPPWNGMGLGSNPVGGGRKAQKGSLWDSLHPGRKGRPGGTADFAALAAKRISEGVERVKQGFDDPRLQRMHEKIMRFV